MRHLLCRASWDADEVRDDVRAYVVGHLYDEAAVLVVDETGDLRKAPAPSGSSASTPARPYGSRTHVAVYLALRRRAVDTPSGP